LSLYQKNQPKGKNFKALLAEDQDDIAFYEKLRKRDADKAIMSHQARGFKPLT
jgi:hypothetical protein